jgi:hypothetical protein
LEAVEKEKTAAVTKLRFLRETEKERDERVSASEEECKKLRAQVEMLTIQVRDARVLAASAEEVNYLYILFAHASLRSARNVTRRGRNSKHSRNKRPC